MWKFFSREVETTCTIAISNLHAKVRNLTQIYSMIASCQRNVTDEYEIAFQCTKRHAKVEIGMRKYEMERQSTKWNAELVNGKLKYAITKWHAKVRNGTPKCEMERRIIKWNAKIRNYEMARQSRKWNAKVRDYAQKYEIERRTLKWHEKIQKFVTVSA